MRKLHLLQAEWRSQETYREKCADYRAYQLLRCQFAGEGPHPQIGEIFSSWAEDQKKAEGLLTEDDYILFSQASAMQGAM